MSITIGIVLFTITILASQKLSTDPAETISRKRLKIPTVLFPFYYCIKALIGSTPERSNVSTVWYPPQFVKLAN